MSFAKCPVAVVFDFDGTLAASRQPITKEQTARLCRLIECMPIGVMSGSAFNIIERNFLSRLEKDFPKEQLYIFPNASSMCFVWKDGEWNMKYNFSLSESEHKVVISALEEAIEKTGITIGLPSYGPRIDNRGTEIAFAGLGIDAPLVEKEAWDPDRKKRISLQVILREKLPDFEVHIGGTTTVEITKKGIDKSYGIMWLARELDEKTSDLLFVGDALTADGNDAAVIPTGVMTQQISGPEETGQVIEQLCSACEKKS